VADNINVTIEDAQPISITIEDAQPISITIAGYAGDTDIYSNPPSGCYSIVNMYLDANLKIVVVYNDVVI